MCAAATSVTTVSSFNTEQLAPVSSILPTQTPLTPEKVSLIYHVALRTIQALREHHYSAFDGLTTSNCCHGVALRAHYLIQSIDLPSLDVVKGDLQQALKSKKPRSNLNLPVTLIELSKLFMLRYVREDNEIKGKITFAKLLQQLEPHLTPSFCNKTITRMQKECANKTAQAYASITDLSAGTTVNSVPVATWGKYAASPFLVSEKGKVHFASNLYSMEVTMASLIKNQSVVALISDLKDASGKKNKGRLVKLLKGNGKDNFEPLSEKEASLLNPSTSIFVFGGCTHSEQMDLDGLSLKLSPWTANLPGLVLANDCHYPQFPPRLKCPPITPKESVLTEQIEKHSQLDGVSFEDRSLFFLAHLYPASVREVREGNLPIFEGPTIKH